MAMKAVMASGIQLKAGLMQLNISVCGEILSVDICFLI